MINFLFLKSRNNLFSKEEKLPNSSDWLISTSWRLLSHNKNTMMRSKLYLILYRSFIFVTLMFYLSTLSFNAAHRCYNSFQRVLLSARWAQKKLQREKRRSHPERGPPVLINTKHWNSLLCEFIHPSSSAKKMIRLSRTAAANTCNTSSSVRQWNRVQKLTCSSQESNGRVKCMICGRKRCSRYLNHHRWLIQSVYNWMNHVFTHSKWYFFLYLWIISYAYLRYSIRNCRWVS